MLPNHLCQQRALRKRHPPLTRKARARSSPRLSISRWRAYSRVPISTLSQRTTRLVPSRLRRRPPKKAHPQLHLKALLNSPKSRVRLLPVCPSPKPNLQPTSPPKSRTDWPPSSIHSHRSRRPRGEARTSLPELSHRRFQRASKQRASCAPTSMMMKLRSGEGLRWMRPRDGLCPGRKKWGVKAASR